MNEEEPRKLDEIEIRLLLDAIYLRYHYDFKNYAMASLKRRLGAALSGMGCATLSQLQDRLLHDAQAFSELLQYLTVQVSDMFRDPDFFRVFRTQIVPVLRTYPSLKLWVAGCSTGEELYSFAIVLREEGLLERSVLYATDINPEALRRAEAGIYPLDHLATYTDNHRRSGATVSLSRYFTAAYGSAVFDRTLRKSVVFSDHSLATDSVFAEMHVISCRNVLIYFNQELRNRALDLMTDSLRRRGYLGLGSKETIQFSSQSSAYRDIATAERWYQKW
jgi:chemotaxis protein methyltransferase CheR